MVSFLGIPRFIPSFPAEHRQVDATPHFHAWDTKINPTEPRFGVRIVRIDTWARLQVGSPFLMAEKAGRVSVEKGKPSEAVGFYYPGAELRAKPTS